MTCPICRKKLAVRVWHDDVVGASVKTEHLYVCPENHYRDHWSYGLHEVIVGARQFGWSHHTPEAEVKEIEAQIDTECAIARATWRARS